MRVYLILFIIGNSLSAFGMDNRSMNELFRKYDQVMLQKKVELVDEVFSEKFLKENGGKAEFIDKVKELPTSTEKSGIHMPKVTWKKGAKGEMYFAKLVPLPIANKSVKVFQERPEFIVVKEKGKLKIDGTLGDAE